MDFDLLADCFKAMSDKTRLTILALVKHEELCVCELVEILEMTQPAVSQHLRKLKQAKLVSETRRGQWVFYSLSDNLSPFMAENLNALPDIAGKIDDLRAKGLKVCCP